MNPIKMFNWDADERFPVRVDSSVLRVNSGCVIPLHCHDYYEFEFIMQGCITNTINGSPRIFSRGMLCALTPDDVHRYDRCTENLHVFKIRFQPRFITKELAEAVEALPMPLVQCYEDKELECLWEEYKKVEEAFLSADVAKPLTMLRLRGASELFLFHILSHPSDGEPCPCQSEAVMKGIRYIRTHLAEPLRIPDIAASVYLSADYFGHLFKRYTSMTVSDFIIENRMRLAYELLCNTDLPVSKVAEQTGYHSPSLFYRHVRMFFGKTPKKISQESLT